MIGNTPDGWRVEKLENLCDVATGKKDANHGVEDGKYPFFTCAAKPIKSNTYNFEGKSIILAGNGANVGLALYFDGKFEAYQRTYILNNFTENSRYIFYNLKRYWIIHNESRQFGSATNYIKMDNITKYPILIPPLTQQEKIVKVLDISSQLIEKQKELIKDYDLFLKSKFIEMFGDPIKNPMGWEVDKIGNITNVQTGKTPSRKNSDYWENGTVNWAKTTEVNQGVLTNVEEQITDLAVKECNMISFPNNTILIAMYGQGKTRGKVALLGVSTTINQAFGAILSNESFKTLYLLKSLDYMYDSIRDLGRGGNQENLNLDIVRGIKIILPPIELQNKFALIVEKIETIKSQETKKLEHLEMLHKSLMNKAFKGEIK